MLLDIKTVVLRDNDKDYASNCVANYSDYTKSNIKIFSDSDNSRYTFEVCLYQDNKAVCDELLLPGRKTITVQDYMLGNKADVAFELLDKKETVLIVPNYIQEAIKWIKE
jgi:putative ATP-dependent endonuclease of OLD family